MNREFINKTIQTSVYTLKEGTETSYYWQSGSKVLPNRLSISFDAELSKAQHKGRMLSRIVLGEVKGTFTKVEVSPLKQNKPFCIHSKIFQSEDYPSLAGYSVIAVSNSENGKCTNEEGLLIFDKIAENTLQLYYMAGVTCNPSDLLAVLDYVLSQHK